MPKNLSRREQEATYWGHKFETLCMINNATKDTSHLEPLAIRREVPVNTNAEFGTVVQTRLGRFRFILGAEVDGLDQRGEEYIELKTSKIRERPFDYQNFNQ